MRQAFREALSTFDSKNAFLESLDGFRYNEFLSGKAGGEGKEARTESQCLSRL